MTPIGSLEQLCQSWVLSVDVVSVCLQCCWSHSRLLVLSSRRFCRVSTVAVPCRSLPRTPTAFSAGALTQSRTADFLQSDVAKRIQRPDKPRCRFHRRPGGFTSACQSPGRVMNVCLLPSQQPHLRKQGHRTQKRNLESIYHLKRSDVMNPSVTCFAGEPHTIALPPPCPTPFESRFCGSSG